MRTCLVPSSERVEPPPTARDVVYHYNPPAPASITVARVPLGGFERRNARLQPVALC